MRLCQTHKVRCLFKIKLHHDVVQSVKKKCQSANHTGKRQLSILADTSTIEMS